MEIQHPRHQHPLVLRENLGNEQETCDLCRFRSSGTAFSYYCVQCTSPHFCLHYACAVTLPQQLNHPLHPHHPLALLTGRVYTCPICRVNHRPRYYDIYAFEPQHPKYSSYTCTECNFDMHLDCAMFPSIIYYRGRDHIQQPLCHLQPMALVEKVDGECFICRLPCDPSGPAFACSTCKYLIHKLCSDLPSEITHPFHPNHHLFLRAKHRGHACRSCEKKRYTFVFECDSCRFNICVACSSLRPTIEYEGHDHLLCFVEMDRSPGICDAHGAHCQQSVVVKLLSCKQPFNILRCVQCDFNVHILCGPLPRTIKHKCHVHPLTLFDLVIEDDSGEYYCDACEMRRNPQLRVYYCAKCKFVADVYCVLSEVTSILKGDLKNVKLINVAGRKLIVTEMEEPSPKSDNDNDKIVNALAEQRVGDHGEGKFASMTLNDLVKKLTGKEREIVDSEYDSGTIYFSREKYRENKHPKQVEDFIRRFSPSKTDENSIKDLNRFLYEQPTTTPLILSDRNLKPTPEQLVKGIKEFSPLTDRDFTELMRSLHHSNSSGKITLLHADLCLKVVKVGDYMMTWNLAHVLKELLAKHGDISRTESKLSMEMKSIIFYLLCGVINSICKTMFIEVTKDVLKNWLTCLQIAKSNGFKIDFVYAHLEGVMHAFFGIHTTRVENDVVAQMDQMLASLKQEVDRLSVNLESCMEYREKYRNSEKSNFIKECLSEASTSTWKIVGRDLL